MSIAFPGTSWAFAGIARRCSAMVTVLPSRTDQDDRTKAAAIRDEAERLITGPGRCGRRQIACVATSPGAPAECPTVVKLFDESPALCFRGPAYLRVVSSAAPWRRSRDGL
jgi:hypothetical protein